MFNSSPTSLCSNNGSHSFVVMKERIVKQSCYFLFHLKKNQVNNSFSSLCILWVCPFLLSFFLVFLKTKNWYYYFSSSMFIIDYYILFSHLLLILICISFIFLPFIINKQYYCDLMFLFSTHPTMKQLQLVRYPIKYLLKRGSE